MTDGLPAGVLCRESAVQAIGEGVTLMRSIPAWRAKRVLPIAGAAAAAAEFTPGDPPREGLRTGAEG
jgi:hypothetical protein